MKCSMMKLATLLIQTRSQSVYALENLHADYRAVHLTLVEPTKDQQEEHSESDIS